MTDYSEIWERAYALLDKLTPIKADCGELCKKRCCKGNDEDGMILFPYEKEFLIGQRSLTFSQKDGFDTAVCKGRCKREWRPLACRIYPFVPVFKNETIVAQPDPRATYICPLILHGVEYIDPEFIHSVKEAFVILEELPGFSDFMMQYDEMLDEYRKFTI
ncbi:MAG TPA: hypothetical protein PK854_00195 [Oscillospiraceae bacterium]|nr:hypothetical protein [Oscillospiraceae bacterium]HPS33671.1 hypothetical protein [Oscillospiraceae bacterium]